MATHLDDEDELEKLKTWWKENWLALAAGLGIGFGGIGGWELYKNWRYERSVEASRLYEQMQGHLQSDEREQAASNLTQIEDNYSGTPYALAALLAMAKAQVDAGELDAAAASLSRASKLSGDPALANLARLRHARVLLALERHDEALALLKISAGPYESLYAEVRGDIELAKGNRDAALSAYEKALSAAATEARNIESLRRKRDDLTGVSS